MAMNMPPSAMRAPGRTQAARGRGSDVTRGDRPGPRRKLNPFIEPDFIAERVEKMKASIRAKVEHPFRELKRQFGFTKVRYRGLAKNTAQLVTLSNLWMARRQLLEAQGRVRPRRSECATSCLKPPRPATSELETTLRVPFLRFNVRSMAVLMRVLQIFPNAGFWVSC